MMTYENIELQNQRQNPLKPKEDDKSNLKRVYSNRLMLDLRQQVQWQRQVISTLKSERDTLTSELASRLVFVESQLRREQKKIEALLDEKDQFIQFQSFQIQSLKSLLSPSDSHAWEYHFGGYPMPVGIPDNRKSNMACPLSTRYSMAINEYMRNSGVVSHASPVMVRMDDYGRTDSHRASTRSQRPRTLSLPELRVGDAPPPYENVTWECLTNLHPCSRSVIDEYGIRRWTSDCESEHSDSLDSGISSPSVKIRNRHLSGGVSLNPKPATIADRPRRTPSLDGFLQRAFSLSCKSRFNSELNGIDNSGKNSVYQGSKGKQEAEQKKINRFPSSANRNFGTNHRSVTKPRDIKFKKLFKFRRRSDPTGSEGFAKDDYMTV